MVTLKICNFNLLDVAVIEEITMTRQQLKNEKQQAERNLCLKGFHILKFIYNKYKTTYHANLSKIYQCHVLSGFKGEVCYFK